MSQGGGKFDPTNELIARNLEEMVCELDKRGHDIAAAHVQLALDLFREKLGDSLPPKRPL